MDDKHRQSMAPLAALQAVVGAVILSVSSGFDDPRWPRRPANLLRSRSNVVG
jgi:hypothetical protein